LPAGTLPVGWTSDGGLYLVRQSPDGVSWAVTRWNRITRREQAVRTLRADLYLVTPSVGSGLTDPVGVPGGTSNFFFSPDGSWYVFQYPRLHSDLYVIEGLE
jgi:hypothetical protein